MAIKTRSDIQKQEIALSGPEGNAFVILGYAQRYAKQLKLDWEQIKTEMTASDYENLIEVFDFHFGDYVDLVR